MRFSISTGRQQFLERTHVLAEAKGTSVELLSSAIGSSFWLVAAVAPMIGRALQARWLSCFPDMAAYEACCVQKGSCGLDGRLFTEKECCAHGEALLNPYAFTTPPSVLVPAPEAWPARAWPEKDHPSFTADH